MTPEDIARMNEHFACHHYDREPTNWAASEAAAADPDDDEDALPKPDPEGVPVTKGVTLHLHP